MVGNGGDDGVGIEERDGVGMWVLVGSAFGG